MTRRSRRSTRRPTKRSPPSTPISKATSWRPPARRPMLVSRTRLRSPSSIRSRHTVPSCKRSSTVWAARCPPQLIGPPRRLARVPQRRRRLRPQRNDDRAIAPDDKAALAQGVAGARRVRDRVGVRLRDAFDLAALVADGTSLVLVALVRPKRAQSGTFTRLRREGDRAAQLAGLARRL